MRFTLLFTASVLAASIGLSACSGGSQAIPGGSQTASSMGRHQGQPQIVPKTITHDSCNYSTYYECVTVTKKTPFTQEWCISTNGSCGSPCCGTDWTWTLPITTLKGKAFKKLHSAWAPDPGNPSTLTISEKKKVKKSHGKVKYEGNLTACSPTYGCLYAPPIGIITN